MNRPLILAVSIIISTATIAGAEKLVPPRRDMRTNPPGKIIAPGYYVSNAFKHETVTIECSDGYKMAGDSLKRVRLPGQDVPAILFLHEAGKSRRSWYPLTTQIAGRNYIVLAIDLRGCGENPQLNGNLGKTLDKLPEAELQIMLEDIRNALSFLSMSSGVDPTNIGIIGSGLGANLAIAAAAEPWAANVKLVIALSPSLNDHGIKTEEAARKIEKTTVRLAASRGDATSYQASATLFSLLPGQKYFFEGEGAASGVGLFGTKSAAPAKVNEESPILFALLPQWLYDGLMKKSPALPAARKTATH